MVNNVKLYGLVTESSHKISPHLSSDISDVYMAFFTFLSDFFHFLPGFSVLKQRFLSMYRIKAYQKLRQWSRVNSRSVGWPMYV